MRLLFLSAWYPYPPQNGIQIRLLNVLRGLAERHEVSLLCFDTLPNRETHPAELRQLCVKIESILWQPFQARSPRALWGYFGRRPRSISATFVPEMGQAIRRFLADDTYDLVVVCELGMIDYKRFCDPVPAVLEALELMIYYQPLLAADTPFRRWRASLTWLKMLRFLRRALPEFRLITTVSTIEQQLLAELQLDQTPVMIVPNGVHVASYVDKNLWPDNVWSKNAPSFIRPTLIYTGALSYAPNYEAMCWFLAHVYPQIQVTIPGVSLIITGDHQDRPLPPSTQVRLTGLVPDIRPLVAAATVSLAPLQQGGGTRLKILEAMALRTPVVATSKGAEGLDVAHNEHLLLADTAVDFAAAVTRIVLESALGRRLATNAYHLVSKQYDWAVILPPFLDRIEQEVAGMEQPTMVESKAL